MYKKKVTLITKTKSYTCTKDGEIILVNTHAFSIEDVEKAANSGADGIGLLSTDFMYLNRSDLPSEEEQYEILCRISRLMGNRPVTVRTLQLSPSLIPALRDDGLADEYRGSRLGLARPDILNTQLRAFIRASALGNFRLLLPMIADVSEILRIKESIATIHNEFHEKNISYDSIVKLGIEVEVPAVTVIAPGLASETSFFSFSEKLLHHTVMVSTADAKLGELLHDYAPSFLFQINTLANEVRPRRKSVCVTAPLAGQAPAIPLLVALGVNELVMSPKDIGQARQIITRLTMSRAKLVASKAMSFRFSDEIKRYAEECLTRLIK